MRRYYYHDFIPGLAKQDLNEITVQVFPNPSSNFTGFNFKLEKSEEFRINIFNPSGHMMHSVSEQATGEITYILQHIYHQNIMFTALN